MIKYKKIIPFIVLSLVMAWVAGSQIRYIFIAMPVILLVLGDMLSEKQFNFQLLQFLIVSLLIISPYVIQIKYDTKGYELQPFVQNILSLNLNTDFKEDLIAKELIQISKEYPDERFIVGNNPDDYQTLAHIYWGNEINEFISIQDYELFLRNESVISSGDFCSRSKPWNRRDICIKAQLLKTIDDQTDYDSIEYALTADEKLDLENFRFIKKYDSLSLYQKK